MRRARADPHQHGDRTYQAGSSLLRQGKFAEARNESLAGYEIMVKEAGFGGAAFCGRPHRPRDCQRFAADLVVADPIPSANLPTRSEAIDSGRPPGRPHALCAKPSAAQIAADLVRLGNQRLCRCRRGSSCPIGTGVNLMKSFIRAHAVTTILGGQAVRPHGQLGRRGWKLVPAGQTEPRHGLLAEQRSAPPGVGSLSGAAATAGLYTWKMSFWSEALLANVKPTVVAGASGYETEEPIAVGVQVAVHHDCVAYRN